MLQITPGMKIFVGCRPVDFRKGHDGLSADIKQILKEDPFSGSVFVFTNKAKNGFKIIVYDGQGLWCCHKRLSEGRLKWWPKSEEECLQLDAKNLMILIWNGDLNSVRFANDWKKLMS